VSQAAVVPLRRGNGGLEMCLIRRRGGRKWGVPKGFVDRGQTIEEAALNEAFEEAGLRGEILGDAIGTYHYRKWGALLAVTVHLMNVLEEDVEWMEMSFRARGWFSIREAELLLADHPIRPLLDSVRAQLAVRFP
jgi:8-oxo-dGTP pyrophosphatase MutT (NUDIX family)